MRVRGRDWGSRKGWWLGEWVLVCQWLGVGGEMTQKYREQQRKQLFLGIIVGDAVSHFLPNNPFTSGHHPTPHTKCCPHLSAIHLFFSHQGISLPPLHCAVRIGSMPKPPPVTASLARNAAYYWRSPNAGTQPTETRLHDITTPILPPTHGAAAVVLQAVSPSRLDTILPSPNTGVWEPNGEVTKGIKETEIPTSINTTDNTTFRREHRVPKKYIDISTTKARVVFPSRPPIQRAGPKTHLRVQFDRYLRGVLSSNEAHQLAEAVLHEATQAVQNGDFPRGCLLYCLKVLGRHGLFRTMKEVVAVAGRCHGELMSCSYVCASLLNGMARQRGETVTSNELYVYFGKFPTKVQEARNEALYTTLLRQASTEKVTAPNPALRATAEHQVQATLKVMKQRKVPRTHHTQGCLLYGAASFAEGLEIYNKIPQSYRITANMMALTSTLSHAGSSEVQQCLSHFSSQGALPLAMYTVLLSCLRKEKDHDNVVRVYRESKVAGIDLPVVTVVAKHCRDAVSTEGDPYDLLAEEVWHDCVREEGRGGGRGRHLLSNASLLGAFCVIAAKVGDTKRAKYVYGLARESSGYAGIFAQRLHEDLKIAGVQLFPSLP